MLVSELRFILNIYSRQREDVKDASTSRSVQPTGFKGTVDTEKNQHHYFPH